MTEPSELPPSPPTLDDYSDGELQEKTKRAEFRVAVNSDCLRRVTPELSADSDEGQVHSLQSLVRKMMRTCHVNVSGNSADVPLWIAASRYLQVKDHSRGAELDEATSVVEKYLSLDDLDQLLSDKWHVKGMTEEVESRQHYPHDAPLLLMGATRQKMGLHQASLRILERMQILRKLDVLRSIAYLQSRLLEQLNQLVDLDEPAAVLQKKNELKPWFHHLALEDGAGEKLEASIPLWLGSIFAEQTATDEGPAKGEMYLPDVHQFLRGIDPEKLDKTLERMPPDLLLRVAHNLRRIQSGHSLDYKCPNSSKTLVAKQNTE